MENRIQQLTAAVKSKLFSCHTIKAKSDWTEECLKFFLSQNAGMSDEELYQAAFEQFLLADVNGASNPVIPGSVKQNKQPFTLYGTFVLQLQFLIDIGKFLARLIYVARNLTSLNLIAESPYEQHRRLHNIRLDEVNEIRESKAFKTKRKRMFKLELCDGHNTICAMEYSTIKVLNTKLSPGTKLKVIGPLKVVNHILLLEPKNLEILGGDVDHLLITNAYENVLLRALDKPTTNNPLLDYNEELLTDETNQRINNAVPSQRVGNLQPANQAPPPAVDEFADIDFDDDFDMESLMQMEQEEARIREARAIEQQAAMEIDRTETVIVPVAADNPIEFIEINEEDIRPVVRSQRPPRVSSETIVIDDDIRVMANGSKSLSRTPQISQQNSDEPATKKIARIEPTNMTNIADDYYKFKSHTGDNMVTVDQYLVIRS